MASPTKVAKIRTLLGGAWMFLVGSVLYLFFFHRESIQGELASAYSLSALAATGVYLLFGCLRGFTLIPSTYLVLAGIPFFPAWPLLGLTLVGILASSSCIYLFAESLRLDEYFERKHPAGVAKIKNILQKNQLPIIIGWSFFPLAPTDLICYACGVLEVDFKKFLFGVLLGEGTICGIYIFFGDQLLRWLNLK
jgi:uncharacterized membrane protein YdjX (TVP38/TMEM64 family)